MHALTRTIALTATTFFAAAGTATAHIQAYPTTNGTSTEALVQFGIPHGCDDNGTTKLEVNFPEEFVSVRPINGNGWTGSGGTSFAGHAMHDDESHGSMEMEGDGSMESSEDGTSTVTWTAESPAAADEYHVVSAWIVVPAESADTLWLPAIQTCEGGDTYEWTTKELGAESPAPYLQFDAAASSTASDDGDGGEDEDDSEEAGPIAIVALVLGALGTLLGIGAILRSRGRD